VKHVWVIVFGISFLAAQVNAEDALTLKSQKDKENYGVGVSVARNFKRQGIEIDMDLVVKGMKDELSGGKLLMSEKELRKTMTAFQAELRRKQRHAMRLAQEENRKKGEAFLAENAKKEGVVTLPSGLQYRILRQGTGKTPTDASTVEVNYRGTRIDGTEFDSSEEGKPSTFSVKGGVIPGLREALKLMPEGSKWELFIPSQLAYGTRGAGIEIGPNETLVFELELVAVK
jgi:FKBP-type peptidyl-prolyl cis-trans isomerase FklB